MQGRDPWGGSQDEDLDLGDSWVAWAMAPKWESQQEERGRAAIVISSPPGPLTSVSSFKVVLNGLPWFWPSVTPSSLNPPYLIPHQPLILSLSLWPFLPLLYPLTELGTRWGWAVQGNLSHQRNTRKNLGVWQLAMWQQSLHHSIQLVCWVLSKPFSVSCMQCTLSEPLPPSFMQAYCLSLKLLKALWLMS